MAKKMSAKMSRKAYSLREVAEMFGVSVDTVRRWEQRGRLPIHRLDGRAWVLADDVDALVASIKSRCFAPDDAAAGS